jgi:hypothetical protein
MSADIFEQLTSFTIAAGALDPSTRDSVREGLYATGHWLLANERYADAAEVLRVMCMVAPGDERGFLALGAAHESEGQLEVAKDIYATGWALSSPCVRCGIALSRALRRLGDVDGSEEVLSALCDSDIDDADLAALVASERRAA